MTTTIGDWTLVRKIASGGMGTVWKVTKKIGMGMPIVGAMKIPLAHVAADDRETRRFLEEARMLTALDHPNIVRVLDAGLDHGVPFLVMQWINGVDLLNLRKGVQASGGQFSVAAALLVTARVLAALSHAHTREIAGRRLGIIHRDVKPANVLISSEGHVLLTDFGVASMLGDEATGNAHGTPRYMSPEQFRGRPTHQTDIWGTGTVLWEMLAGTAFRSDLSSQEVIERLVTESVVMPPPLRPDFTVDLLKLLQMRLLAVQPDQRFDSAAVAMDAVEACQGFDARATGELRTFVRKLRPENSGFTELMTAIPEESHLEIDVIMSAASGRHSPISSMGAMGMAVEDAPTDKHTLPPSSIDEDDDPSDPTMIRPSPLHSPASPTVAIKKAVLPDPDAPTQLRRPHRPRRMHIVVPPPARDDPPDIVGVIDTPVLVPQPAGTVPPADTHRLPRHDPPSEAQRRPTDLLTPKTVAAILATTPPPPARAPEPAAFQESRAHHSSPWGSSWYSSRPESSGPQADPSLALSMVEVRPLLEPYQKRFFIGLLAAIALLSLLVVLLLRE